jgi:hypothetical protein
VILAGRASESSLYQRLVAEFEDERMPQKAPPLSAEQIELLRRWIDAGASWPDSAAGRDERGAAHWAYAPPRRAPVPPAAPRSDAANPIDAFIDLALAREGLAPTPEADRATLLRRVSLDLIGLPPALDELERFESDTRADAYGAEVARLLASPHFGERMARPWLDVARYADSQGYEKDARRSMHPYRDWVIEAFNRNLAFDRFTIAQLAGDLLPGATPADRVATGFHRNTMLNEEGGVDAEEFRCDAVIDRVNTTAAIWLGSTLACAQCHDHKYDPFSQRDYYRMLAAFNSTADGGRERAPTLAWPSASDTAELQRIDARLAEIESELAAPQAQLDASQTAWESSRTRSKALAVPWTTLAPTSVRADPLGAVDFSVDDAGCVSVSGAEPDRVSYVVRAAAPVGEFGLLRLEALDLADGASKGPGRASHGNFVLSELRARHVRGGSSRALALARAEAAVEQSNGPFRAAHAIDGEARTGWAIGDQIGRAHEAVFSLAEPVTLEPGDELELRLEFHSPYARHALGRFRIALSGDAREVARLASPRVTPWRVAGPFSADTFESARDTAFAPELEFVAGQPLSASYDEGRIAWRALAARPGQQRFELTGERCATYLTCELECGEPRSLELFLGGDDVLRVWLNGQQILESRDYATYTENAVRARVRLARGTNRLLAKVTNGGGGYGFAFGLGGVAVVRAPPELEIVLRAPRATRTPEQTARLRAWYRREWTERGAELADEEVELRRRRTAVEAAIPTAMVLEELAHPRSTHVFVRGSFLTPGERVEPGIPALFGELQLGGVAPRLALARWLVGPDNPLAARAHVNRLWELVFGRGLVATPDDFGLRGDAPSHPELLDWLACELVDSGWDQKHLIRLLVTSRAYRRSADAGAAAFARDPDNVFVARAARPRLEAEMLRDVALASSGLLTRTIGGPSVFPPQPPGIWNSAYSGDDWQESVGEQRWRRGIYTFAKRTAPYVTHALFDAPSREVTCTRRMRTNTPLQALALLDDPTFVEAAVALARRMLREVLGDDAARIAFGFRVCAARRPTASETRVLAQLVDDARRMFAADPEAAQQRVALLEHRELAPIELAAWTSVATVLLNLEDTMVRR